MTDNVHTGLRTPSQALREQLLTLARFAADMCIREHGGNNRGPEVEAIIRMAGGKGAIPWCLALQHVLYEQACKAVGITPKLDLGLSCSALVHSMTKLGRMLDWQAARAGDLFVIRGGDTGYQHVGILGTPPMATSSVLHFWSIEGNTNEAGSSEGDGIYRKERRMHAADVVFIDITS
jgi:hypothetical protein